LSTYAFAYLFHLSVFKEFTYELSSIELQHQLFKQDISKIKDQESLISHKCQIS